MTSLVETKDIWKNNLVFALYPLASVKKAKKRKKEDIKERENHKLVSVFAK